MQIQISVYVRLDQAQRLQQEKNQSRVVRDALDLYYAKGESNMADHIEMTAGEFRERIAEDMYWQEDEIADPETLLLVYADGSIFFADDPTVAIEGPCEEMAEFLGEGGYFEEEAE